MSKKTDHSRCPVWRTFPNQAIVSAVRRQLSWIHIVALTSIESNPITIQRNKPIKLTDYQFLQQLAALPFVEALYLFGSRARGDGRERSDIDLAVVCPNASYAQWLQVLAIIEQADTLLTIDCVRLDAEPASSPLKAAIEQDKQVLYER